MPFKKAEMTLTKAEMEPVTSSLAAYRRASSAGEHSGEDQFLTVPKSITASSSAETLTGNCCGCGGVVDIDVDVVSSGVVLLLMLMLLLLVVWGGFAIVVVSGGGVAVDPGVAAIFVAAAAFFVIVVVVVVFVTLFPVVDLKKVLACFHLWLIDCGGI